MSKLEKVTEEKRRILQATNKMELETWRNFLDIPLTLTVELGRVKMTVEKILDLQLDSVIALKRSSAEGVDVMVNNQCLAHGEILTIEDRTGVRINEIVIPKIK
jgi:flagellar motor switch protein FliN/FliY